MNAITIVFVFSFLVLTRYLMSSHDHGSEIARQLMPRDWAFSLYMALCISLGRPWYFILPFVCLIFFGIARLAHVVKRSDGSQVLLRWRLDKQWRSFIIFVLFLVGFLLAYSIVARQPIRVDDLLLLGLLFILGMAISYLEKETCLTESGVETGSEYIRWEQIQSYRWSLVSENKETRIFFKTSRHLPIFNLVQLNLPVEQKQAVNEIVLRKVQHVLAAPEITSTTS